MRKYIFIGIGGIAGAILRYLGREVQLARHPLNIPLNTLLINIAGTFILALVLTVAFEVQEFDTDLRLGLAAGFLGAFTTFSTLCRETVELMNRGDFISALSYIAVSALLGIAAAYIGTVFARGSVSKLIRKYRDEAGKISTGQTDCEVE